MDRAGISRLHAQLSRRLEAMEPLLPKEYRLTLVARHTTRPNADILLSIDDLESVVAAIRGLANNPTAYVAGGPGGERHDEAPGESIDVFEAKRHNLAERLRDVARGIERLTPTVSPPESSLSRAAAALSTWAASINWWPEDTNTADWLDGLRERIKAVQVLTCPPGMKTTMGERLHAPRELDSSGGFTCEGCGADCDAEDGERGWHVRPEPDRRGDPVQVQCGPVSLRIFAPPERPDSSEVGGALATADPFAAEKVYP